MSASEAAGFALETRGSYGGLWALSRGETQAATVHLRDPDTREYNAPFIRRLLPEGSPARAPAAQGVPQRAPPPPRSAAPSGPAAEKPPEG